MIRRLTVWIAALTVAMLTMALVLATAAHAQEAAGDWHGTVSIQTLQMRIGVTITRGADGALAGSLVSPDQSPKPIPLSDVKLAEGKLSFSVPPIRASYEGTWDASAGRWVGTLTQGAPIPLTLAAGPVPALVRPQVPAKPYPYKETDVSVPSVPGVVMACSLTTPVGKGPFPGVVMITGSGAQDRDEALLGHQPFLVISDRLTRRGVAVLRCDDRGFAKSTGVFATATSADFAKDTEAEAAFLRAQPGIDPRHVGLIGHSEGGMIAPMVAAEDPKIAFVVMMAGPGAPIRDLMTAQREAVSRSMGVPPEMIAKNEGLMAKIDVALAQDKPADQAKADAVKVLTDAGMPPPAAAQQVAAVTSAWWKWFIAYDPRINLAKLRVPVLALDGDKDTQVVSKLNLPAIREALKNNRDATVIEMPGLNHLFQDARTGAPSEYGQIEETISPAALDLIADWVVAHTRR